MSIVNIQILEWLSRHIIPHLRMQHGEEGGRESLLLGRQEGHEDGLAARRRRVRRGVLVADSRRRVVLYRYPPPLGTAWKCGITDFVLPKTIAM